MENIFFKYFKNKEDIISAFNLDNNALDDCNILFAANDCVYDEDWGLIIYESSDKYYYFNFYYAYTDLGKYLFKPDEVTKNKLIELLENEKKDGEYSIEITPLLDRLKM